MTLKLISRASQGITGLIKIRAHIKVKVYYQFGLNLFDIGRGERRYYG